MYTPKAVSSESLFNEKRPAVECFNVKLAEVSRGLMARLGLFSRAKHKKIPVSERWNGKKRW
ncbi:hypothetical protein DY000_02009936 [Brassica cretica]|uniref:Uncharacterized protein n=1 Tax=Brassica cretica TaxID=69181 RepID=A0ABQ7CGG0_BRACR|nr:hypothetical protein DY000_02009936 [Brassica cretica]